MLQDRTSKCEETPPSKCETAPGSMQQPTCVPQSGQKVSAPTSKCVLRHSQEKTELLAMPPEMEMSFPTPDELNYDECVCTVQCRGAEDTTACRMGSEQHD